MRLVRMNHPTFDQDLDRFMNSFLGGERSEGTFTPAVDIVETGEEIRVNLELAGVSKDDVSVEFHDNTLILKGEKKAPVLADGENLRRNERTNGSFVRRFEVSTPVNAGDIKAKFNNGVLTVTLPKAEEAKPREISIEL